jgi:hypothetical protein
VRGAAEAEPVLPYKSWPPPLPSPTAASFLDEKHLRTQKIAQQSLLNENAIKKSTWARPARMEMLVKLKNE